MMAKRCRECQDGEHDNYTDEVIFVKVKDPDTGKTVKARNMCSDHIEMYCQDGYDVVTSKGEPA